MQIIWKKMQTICRICISLCIDFANICAPHFADGALEWLGLSRSAAGSLARPGARARGLPCQWYRQVQGLKPLSQRGQLFVLNQKLLEQLQYPKVFKTNPLCSFFFLERNELSMNSGETSDKFQKSMQESFDSIFKSFL